jgi:ABC-type uncharacterized transport system auxiliary subunit
MAGGYKLWSTGEVVTAANLQNYIQNQTVMVFASATARTTALTGVLAEGMISYRTDSHVLEVYNGTAWVAPETNLTTKGDLATYDTAPNRLGVGTDGQVLVANSSASTGLSWQYTYNAFNAQTGTSYTLVAADAAKKLVTVSNSSSITITVPPSVFSAGQTIDIQSIGAGIATFAQGTGVTITSTGASASAPKLRTQYSAATVICTTSNTFTIVGDLA